MVISPSWDADKRRAFAMIAERAKNEQAHAYSLCALGVLSARRSAPSASSAAHGTAPPLCIDEGGSPTSLRASRRDTASAFTGMSDEGDDFCGSDDDFDFKDASDVEQDEHDDLDSHCDAASTADSLRNEYAEICAPVEQTGAKTARKKDAPREHESLSKGRDNAAAPLERQVAKDNDRRVKKLAAQPKPKLLERRLPQPKANANLVESKGSVYEVPDDAILSAGDGTVVRVASVECLKEIIDPKSKAARIKEITPPAGDCETHLRPQAIYVLQGVVSKKRGMERWFYTHFDPMLEGSFHDKCLLRPLPKAAFERVMAYARKHNLKEYKRLSIVQKTSERTYRFDPKASGWRQVDGRGLTLVSKWHKGAKALEAESLLENENVDDDDNEDDDDDDDDGLAGEVGGAGDDDEDANDDDGAEHGEGKKPELSVAARNDQHLAEAQASTASKKRGKEACVAEQSAREQKKHKIQRVCKTQKRRHKGDCREDDNDEPSCEASVQPQASEVASTSLVECHTTVAKLSQELSVVESSVDVAAVGAPSDEGSSSNTTALTSETTCLADECATLSFPAVATLADAAGAMKRTGCDYTMRYELDGRSKRLLIELPEDSCARTIAIRMYTHDLC